MLVSVATGRMTALSSEEGVGEGDVRETRAFCLEGTSRETELRCVRCDVSDGPPLESCWEALSLTSCVTPQSSLALTSPMHYPPCARGEPHLSSEVE